MKRKFYAIFLFFSFTNATIQHNTIQHDTIQKDTIQLDTIRHNTIRHDTIRHNTIRRVRRSPELGSPVASGEGFCSNDTEVVNAIMFGHNKRRIPGDGHSPVNVTFERKKTFFLNISIKPQNYFFEIKVWVQEISKIKEISSEFELDAYVTETWTDPSLSFDHITPCRNNISLDGPAMLKQIWYPNGCFINSKNASIHMSPIKNIYLVIYAKGGVWLNYRIKLTGPCEKNLKTFPIDFQRCTLAYESYTYNRDKVQLHWNSEMPIFIMKEIRLPDYDLTNYSVVRVMQVRNFSNFPKSFKFVKNFTFQKYPPGDWDELVVTFIFQRKYGFYVLQAYVPAYINVFMSWVSFYFGAKSIPARTMVGVNALLALTFQVKIKIKITKFLAKYFNFTLQNRLWDLVPLFVSVKLKPGVLG